MYSASFNICQCMANLVLPLPLSKVSNNGTIETIPLKSKMCRGPSPVGQWLRLCILSVGAQGPSLIRGLDLACCNEGFARHNQKRPL